MTYWKTKPDEPQPEKPELMPFAFVLGDEDRDARDVSQLLPNGTWAPRGVISTVEFPPRRR